MPRVRAFFLLFLALASCVLAACEAEGPAAPPDLVLVVVDTLRRDHLSPYGAALATPNVQRLAEEGQVFTDLQASFHQTAMSMGALFTGRTPSLESADPGRPLAWNGHNWCGMTRFAEGPADSCVPQRLTTLAESLRDAGYWTAGIVSNRLLFAPAGYEQGFDAWVEVGASDPDLPIETLVQECSAERVNAALEKTLAQRPDVPAFVYVHYMDVHDYSTRGETYAQAVERMDAGLGRLLEILEEADLREHAVIFLTSDHGENLGEQHYRKRPRSHMGNPSYQPLLDVPLIVAPAIFDHPERRLRTTGIGDLVRRAAGLPIPRSEDVLEPDEVFLTERYYLTYRRGRWKSAFHRKQMGRWVLFDLANDPGETKNMITSEEPVAAEQLARVRELSRALAASTTSEEGLSQEDRARLLALGYLDQEQAAAAAESESEAESKAESEAESEAEAEKGEPGSDASAAAAPDE